MTSLALIALVGFVLGMRHATDPDHVIAVTTIVSKQRHIGKAGLIGAMWGFGHTLTILIVGVAIILFKIVIPTRLGLSMELAVGLMLILLGILNLTGVLQRLTNRFAHNHPHTGPAYDTESLPNEAPALESSAPGKHSIGLWNLARPLAIGIVHGLAGSAAVALLVMTTIKDPRWEIVYLLIFGLGTVAGMMLITGLIAVPFAYTSRRYSAWNHRMVYASGLLSLCFGLFVSYQTGIVGGLFTSHPHWTPH
ncbi:HoxN/HupN/NixA family nickel/cobalt transporter [Acidisarcina polymorpha]|uniref:Nickel/cobalt efflux system n=2 Tax=Acidisarcina polymorpha TaxID=2211140 RepID=A0A2Z5FRY7_9BACT|nr:HoxN/HupN/NixA family nickel/cobalt transporter [Acidisarcina polymorpha]